MKKLIAILLMVALLASLSVCAFAADPSPSQGGGGDNPVTGGGTDEDNDEEPTQEVEIIAAPDPETVKATDEDGNEVEVGVGDEVPEDAAEETKQAVKELTEQKEEATDALKDANNINDAIAGNEEMMEKADGHNFIATEPTELYSPTNTYPMRITLPIDDLDTFITALIFVNGGWEIPDAMEVDEEASTVSFTIYGPCFYSLVYAGDEVAAP